MKYQPENLEVSADLIFSKIFPKYFKWFTTLMTATLLNLTQDLDRYVSWNLNANSKYFREYQF